MNPLSMLNTASKLSPNQLGQSVKDGVLPAGLASLVSGANSTAGSGAQTPPPPGGTVADNVMQGADQAMDPMVSLDHKIKSLSEEVVQIKDGVQDGKIPAYIGIPKLAESVQQLQSLRSIKDQLEGRGQPQPQDMPQGMPQGMPQQAASQPMPQQAPQQAPQGVAAAQSNLPTQGYAPGGIVAFAEGGRSPDDPEYDPSKDDPTEFGGLTNAERALLDKFYAPIGGKNPVDVLPQDQLDTEAMTGVPTNGGGISSLVQQGGAKLHKYANEIIASAKRNVVEPALSLTVGHLETGGSRNPETAKSPAGAEGVMQTMPLINKTYGIKDPTDPMQSIEGGNAFLGHLTQKYGGDPHLILAAYNAGETKVDKALKSGSDWLQQLKPETQNYVRNGIDYMGRIGNSFAAGGEVKRFNGDEDGSYVDPESTWAGVQAVAPGVVGNPAIDAPWYKRLASPELTAQAQAAYAASHTSAEPYAYLTNAPGMAEGDYGVVPKGAVSDELMQALYNPTATPVAPKAPDNTNTTPTTPTSPPSNSTLLEEYYKDILNKGSPYSQEFTDSLNRQKAQLAEQQKLAPWLSLGATGAGMLKEGSNFGSKNIGAGLTQGLGTYAALQQAADKQEQGIGQLLMGAERGDLLRQAHVASVLGQLQGREDLVAGRKYATDVNAQLAQQKVNAQLAEANAKHIEALTKLRPQYESSPQATALEAQIKKDGTDPTTATTMRNNDFTAWLMNNKNAMRMAMAAPSSSGTPGVMQAKTALNQ